MVRISAKQSGVLVHVSSGYYQSAGGWFQNNRWVIIYVTYLSLAIDEFLDIDFGDISKSLSDLYRKLSLRWGRFCRTRPADGDAAPSRGLRPGLAPFSTSKLKRDKTDTC